MELFDDMRHGEGFARAGDAEEGLVGEAVLDAFGEGFDRGGLVAGGGEFGFDAKGF